jgi:pSer/pThr/pTyr-binding forkhead associated (FHA) protein
MAGHETPTGAGPDPSGAVPEDSAGRPVDPVTTGSFDAGTLYAEIAHDVVSAEPGDPAMLVVTRGPGSGSRYALDRPETRIGRHPEAHLFLDDVTVSRRHALVSEVDGTFVLTDQASLNGTYVGNERVDSRVLASGDELQIGRFRLLFLIGSEATSEAVEGSAGEH